jgi:hypothetical protein
MVRRGLILADQTDKNKRSTVDNMHDAARQLAEQRRLRMAAITMLRRNEDGEIDVAVVPKPSGFGSGAGMRNWYRKQ